MKPSLSRCLVAAFFAAIGPLTLPAHAGVHADLQVVSRSTGERLPVYAHGGKLYVVGQPGERYAVQVANRTSGRVLAVVSVDGVNVVSGETAAPDQTGYVLGPRQSYEIAGWRKTADEVAAFYFTSLPDSYAARTDRPGNVGVIGVALFREWAPPRPRPQVQPAPRLHEHDGTSAAPVETPSRRAETAEAAAGPSAGSASESARSRLPAAPQMRDKLGTGHGEREHSSVGYTDFRRATPQPAEVLTLYYDRRENLVARGIIPQGAPRFAEPQPFPGPIRFAPDPRS